MSPTTVEAIEAKLCPNSTDGGLPASNHRIGPDGFCTICDRSTRAIAEMHGIETR